MKTKIFILAALVLSINAVSQEQTASGLSQRYIDSIGQVPTPGPDSAVEYAVTADSTSTLANDSVKTASASASSVSQDKDSEKAIIDAVNAEEKKFYKRVGFWIAIGIIATFLVGILFWWLKKQGVVFKNPFAGFSLEGWEKSRIARMKIRADGKAEAVTTLGAAYASVAAGVGSKKPEWKNSDEVNTFVERMLEGQWFMRKNWKPVFLYGFMPLAIIAAIIALFVWANNPPVIIMTNHITKAAVPQPIITPTVAIIEGVPEEPEMPEYKPITEYHPVATQESHADIVFYVNAFADKDGKPLYGEAVPKPPSGWKDDFWPEEDVWGLVNPNDMDCKTPQFPYGPDRPQIKARVESVAWASRCGHNTRVKVVRRWMGNAKVFS